MVQDWGEKGGIKKSSIGEDVGEAIAMEDYTPATALQKQPPPESPESVRLRGLVIASFWFVVIVLGLPVWLWTTTIHRASLPLDDMLSWADGKVCLQKLTGLS